MFYNLRKRRRDDVETNNQTSDEPRRKKIKNIYNKWQNETLISKKTPPNLKRKISQNVAFGNVLKKFKKFTSEVSTEPEDTESVPVVNLRGVAVSSISDLKTNDEYVKWSANENSNLDFILRKKSTQNAESLRMKEINFDLQLSFREGRVKNLTLQGFMGSLWDVFEKLFNHFGEQKNFDEICFHATHDQLEGSLSSSIFELKSDNRDRAISEIMSRINAWNESSKIGAAIRNIQLSITLLQRNMVGNGKPLLAIGDTNLRRKSFSSTNFTGCILYVDCTEDCFYVSIFLCLLYNAYQLHFNSTNSKNEKKRIQEKLWQTLELTGKNLER